MDTESLILLSSVIDKMEIKKELEDIEGKTNEEVGTKLVVAFATSLHKAKDEVYEFVSLYKDCSIEEAKKVNVIAMIKELVKEVNIKDFLS